jgi:signal transduction histidine kinase
MDIGKLTKDELVQKLMTLQNLLDSHQKLEEALSSLPTTSTSIGNSTIREWIDDSLMKLAHFVDVDRAYIFLLDDDNVYIKDTFEWSVENLEKHNPNELIGLPIANFTWTFEQFKAGNCVLVRSLKELPPEAAGELAFCNRLGTKSYLDVPLFTAGKLQGWIGINSVTKEKEWPEFDTVILKWFGEYLMNLNSRVQFESSIMQNRGELKKEINQRKIVQEELQKAKTKADEANRLKSIILVNLNHELKTPLNTIIGASEILLQGTNRPEHQQLAEMIHTSANRLLNTVNNILELSQIEANILKLHYDKVFLPSFINHTIKKFDDECREKNLALNYNIIDYKVFSMLDVVFFNQILEYLLENAIKYTKKGGIIVELDSTNEQDRHWAVIRVKDSGIGIPKEKIPVIFDEFRQASEGLSRTYEGTGLGLALTKKMVQLMKGTISVESDVEIGSTFIVKFPAVEGD